MKAVGLVDAFSNVLESTYYFIWCVRMLAYVMTLVNKMCPSNRRRSKGQEDLDAGQ